MADKISEKSALEVWKLGVPLRNAPDVFGATRNNSKIKRKARQDASETAAMLKSSVQNTGKGWNAAYGVIESSLASLNEWSGTSIARTDRLFERLRLGNLVALGFPIHLAEADDPVIVPAFLLEREYTKWNQGAFIGLGRHFARVAICEARPNLPNVDETPTAKRVGAPSYSERLERLAAELEKGGVALDARPWKTGEIHALGIRMGVVGFDDRHPSPETIRRFLAGYAATKSGPKTQ